MREPETRVPLSRERMLFSLFLVAGVGSLVLLPLATSDVLHARPFGAIDGAIVPTLGLLVIGTIGFLGIRLLRRIDLREARAHEARAREIAESRNTEARLRALNEDLEARVAERTGELELRATELARSNADLDQFASSVSHDLKSPLRGIASLSEWLVEDYATQLDGEVKERLRLIAARVARMHRLIDGILEYSRVGRVTERASLDLGLLVGDVIDGLEPREHIAVRVDGTLPRVDYDEVQLVRVMQNLIGNAVRHLGKPAGTVTISASERVDAWVVAVADTGVGIAPANHERIFRMFQTLRAPDDDESTGIGLAVVKKIAEANAGSVTVESAPGAGACFRLTIPKRAD